MNALESLKHTTWECKYHVVFIPKYRKKVLYQQLRWELGTVFRDLAQRQESEIIEGHLMADHVHMLVSGTPELSPAKMVQYIKGRSSRRLQDEFPELRKRYWGQHLWARGYFCATVGAVDEKTIREYIENQKWDDDGEAFKITSPTEP